ncbi:diguanylate cyclase (GGDEF) domain-containing protein [Paenibacillus sp. UNCCL117]|uniref:GGDEF domain-containing protein n=1 Tax=unclassified Paenibacillus TaxID=185978 RepID=UPI00088245A4|nr:MULTISPECIES: diguanylate cyclase [unclassified Paenibacillus]SDD92400.1 diguanylate cyclase (GGDEF) domain-containing protein [Paenibacillus sp. cl123]SFW43484.1 diguanylate cyclase (GGDEF) domain-containing protein [Paenibacillus sp. UNCCL117]
MNHMLLELANTRQSYRKMLNLYWITILLTAVLEYAIQHLHVQANPADILPSLAWQAVLLSLVTGLVDLLHRYRNVQSDWLLITMGILYASSIVMMNPTVGIVPAIFIFPIITSVLTFDTRRIAGVFALVLLSFALLYVLSPPLRLTMQPIHIIGILFLYTGTTVIALSIASTGIELLNNLKHATEAKQELLVKNIIMDTLSKIDALTELYNHKTFHEYLEKLIEQHELNELSLQLAILDIDNFKRINDTYGHWVGDIVLLRVAAIIKETVTPNDFVARYGGEEFAVIFTEKTLEEAYRIAELIRQRLYVTMHPELDSKSATISIGLQEYVKGKGKEALFKGADASLYEAKRTGKNKTVVHAASEPPAGSYSPGFLVRSSAE